MRASGAATGQETYRTWLPKKLTTNLSITVAVSLHAESGAFTIHEERYETAAADSGLTLNSIFEYSDEGMKRSTACSMYLWNPSVWGGMASWMASCPTLPQNHCRFPFLVLQ
jgi:hypothetical protein